MSAAGVFALHAGLPSAEASDCCCCGERPVVALCRIAWSDLPINIAVRNPADTFKAWNEVCEPLPLPLRTHGLRRRVWSSVGPPPFRLASGRLALQTLAYQWVWHQHSECDLRRRTRPEIAALFANRRLAFIGDSHVRYFHNWVASALGGDCEAGGVLAGVVCAAGSVVSARPRPSLCVNQRPGALAVWPPH